MKLCVWVLALAKVFATLVTPVGTFSPRGLIRSHMESLYSLRDKLSGTYQTPGEIMNREETGQTTTISSRTINIGSEGLGDLEDGILSDFPKVQKSPSFYIHAGSNTPVDFFPSMPEDLIPMESFTASVKPTVHSKTQFGVPNVSEPGALYKEKHPESGVMQSLFEIGHRNILDSKAESQKKEVLSFESILKSLPFLPFTNGIDSPPSPSGRGSLDNPLMKYLDTIRENAWGQFKSLALGYTNLLEEEYRLQDFTDQLPIDLVKKVLDLGDRVNFLHLVGKKVEPGLAKYLADQLDPLLSRMKSLSPTALMNNSTSNFFDSILRKAAWKTLHMFIGHVSKVAERFVPSGEFAVFHDQLLKYSPIAAKGLDLILNGPDSVEGFLNSTNLVAEGRQINRDYQQSYGYGGYGAYDDPYGHSSSYGSGVTLDPYLILGGIGAAALLAFLAYRLIVTTEGRRRRDADLTLMDMSDMPNIVFNFYNMIESAEEKYDGTGKPPYEADVPEEDTSELANGLNSLWRESQGGECVSCSLFDFVRDHQNLGTNDIESLIMAGVAHLLGAERSGQLVDEVAAVLTERRSVTCERIGNHCHVR